MPVRVVWLLLSMLPLVWGDATTTWDNCYDINLNTGLPGVPRVPVLQPCLHVALDTCGDMSLHASITLAPNTYQFNISSANNFRACVGLPSPYNAICKNLCLQVDPSTYRVTHSYAYFKPYVQLSDGNFCPGTRFPNNPQGYSLGVDCDAQANTSCDECTNASDQGICAWCPATGACVATSSISTALCDGVSTCPNDGVQHLGFCSTQGNGSVPTVGPTVAPPGSCSNPMFAGPLQVTGGRQLSLLPTPAIVVNSSCPNLAGQLQCCAKDTFNQWKQMMQQFDQSAIIASKDKGNIKLDDLIRVLNEYQLLPNLTQPTPAERVQLELLLDIFKTLDQPLQICTKAIVAYWNGLMCFACQPDWRNFYNPDTKALSLSVSTCDAADAGCSPVLRLINSKKWDIIRILIQLYTLSGDHTYDQLKNTMQQALDFVTRFPMLDQDICVIGWKGASNCRQVVCNQFLHGLDYNFTLPTLPTLNLGGGSHAMHTSSSSSSSSSGSSPSTPLAWLVPSVLHSHSPIRSSQIHSMARYLISLTQHINTIHANHMTRTEIVEQQATNAPTGGHAINTYVVGGYDVNTIGCTAQMSTQACPAPATPSSSPSPSSSPTSTPVPSSPSSTTDSKSNAGVVIGVLVGVSIGALALFGLFWYVRKRRTLNRVPPHRRLQDQDFGIGGGATSPDGSAYSRFDPRL